MFLCFLIFSRVGLFCRNDSVFDDLTSHSTSDQSYDIGGDDSSLGIDMEYEVR